MKQIPLGLRDYLPKDIHQRDQLIHQMKDVVEKNNYQRIITPSIENFDRLELALGDLSKDCIMFFDGAGTRLVLRPDHTTPIARISASRLSDSLPIKLYYHDPVFRKDPLLGETEIFQFGCEHIGNLTLVEEVNMIQMVLDVCQSVGLSDIEIHVSHPELFESFSSDDLKRLSAGDFLGLRSLPERGDRETLSGFNYMSELFF